MSSIFLAKATGLYMQNAFKVHVMKSKLKVGCMGIRWAQSSQVLGAFNLLLQIDKSEACSSQDQILVWEMLCSVTGEPFIMYTYNF